MLKFSNSRNIRFRSITYRSGFVYNWLTKRLYDQKKKFVTISEIVKRYNGNGSKVKVMDIPCGSGYLARFLPENVIYEGWDLNHRFLKKLMKDWSRGKTRPKKLILRQKDIFDFDDYPRVDIIILCDILHHVHPHHADLVENAKNNAKRVIICEPVAVKPEDIHARDKFFRLVMKFAKYLPEKIYKLFDFLFFDNDGINDYERRSAWDHDERSLKKMYRQMGFERIYNITDDYIGIWER